MTATELTKALSTETGYKPASKYQYQFGSAIENILSAFDRGIYDSAITRQTYTAWYGIAWTMQTGRVSGLTEKTIKALSPYRALALVAEVTVSCETIGDVPYFLNKKFAAVA